MAEVQHPAHILSSAQARFPWDAFEVRLDILRAFASMLAGRREHLCPRHWWLPACKPDALPHRFDIGEVVFLASTGDAF